MCFLSRLFKGSVERTLDEVSSSGSSELDATERRQARVLDRMTSYDAEHIGGWTGLSHDIPVMEYEDFSDGLARERHEKEVADARW